MLAKDLRQEPKQALLERAEKLREELFKVRFRSTTEPIDKPNLIREKRKDLARIATLLREEELKGKPREPKLSREQRGRKRAGKAAMKAKADHKSRLQGERKRAAENKTKSRAKAAGKKPAAAKK
jgi:large subunit ribosomal protein L29